MFTTIFGKIMMLFMAIILISLYISGAMMSQSMRESYRSETEKALVSIAEDSTARIAIYHAGYGTLDDLNLELKLKANYNQDLIWWVRTDGKVYLYGDISSDYTVDSEKIQEYFNEMAGQLNQGETVKIETEEQNFFSTPVMTVAKPMLDTERGNEYVFVHRKISVLNDALMAIYRQIVLSVAISAVLAIFLTYVFTRYMLRPLTIVTKGARQLSRGHFDIWLEVRSKDEIGQLADTFNSLATDLKKYQQTRDTFVANVSHELRSPLTSMQGLVQGVIDGTIPEDETLHYLNIVLDETKRLNKLITDMLELSKLNSGQFPLKTEEIDVNELIRRALITSESKIDVKNLMVEVEFEDEREIAIANKDRIIQVIQNIMDNAIKFADYGGRLHISTRSDASSVYVSINNTGEPIPRSDLPYLFDRFYKGDESHTRVKEGAGIGLSLVKRILEEHKQRIWVESDRIGGTTFTFTLRRPALPPKEKDSGRKRLG